MFGPQQTAVLAAGSIPLGHGDAAGQIVADAGLGRHLALHLEAFFVAQFGGVQLIQLAALIGATGRTDRHTGEIGVGDQVALGAGAARFSVLD